MADGSQPRRRGKGRPFPPGVSGNPGGKPKSAAGFGAACRDAAAVLLEKVAAGDTSPSLLAALDLCARYGGYLPADKAGDLEVRKALALVEALHVEGLSPEQRQVLVEEWTQRQEPSQAPAPPALPAPERDQSSEQ